MNLPTSQIELFEGFEPTAARAPKLELPFQRSNEIDVQRARAILGVTERTLYGMLERHLIRGYRHPGERSPWHIEYDSIVEYCDRLRVLHCISDQRAGLTPGRRRYRDHELLPFPLSETIYMADVRARLDCSKDSVLHLIQSGALVAYQVIFEQIGSAWRIQASSLDRYVESLHVMAGKRQSARPSASSR
jgi:hypothetical protein